MKIIFLIILNIFTLKSFALFDEQLSTKRNSEYMSFALKSYLNWFKDKFGFEIKLDDGEGDKFLKKALAHLDHWKTKEDFMLNQFQIGQGFNEDKAFYTFKVYISESLREDSYILKSGVKNPFYLEWSPKDGVCLIQIKDDTNFPWSIIEQTEIKKHLLHFCRNSSGHYLKYVSTLSWTPFRFFYNPFVGLTNYEIRTYSKSGLMKIQYFSKRTFIHILPKKHFNFVKRHGEEGLLPFDTYSTDLKGNVIIYYP